MTLGKPFDQSGTPSWQVEKYHGAANDFLFLNLSEAALDWQDIGTEWTERAVTWCDRHRSVGADGVVLWKVTRGPRAEQSHDARPSGNLRIEAAIWNSDGSFAATCGNALRCLALALCRRGLWDGQQEQAIYYPPHDGFLGSTTKILSTAPFATLIRLVTADSYQKNQSKQKIFEVAMGKLQFLGAPESPWNERLCHEMNDALEGWRPILGQDARCEGIMFVQLANPHLIMRLRGVAAGDPLGALEEFLRDEGQRIKDAIAQAPHPMRGKATSQTETIPQPEQLGQVNLGALFQREGSLTHPHVLVVHERGAGVTQACGSGCTAAYAVLLANIDTMNEGSKNLALPIKAAPQVFRMPGGELTMRRQDSGEFIMAGPAEYIASITLG